MKKLMAVLVVVMLAVPFASFAQDLAMAKLEKSPAVAATEAAPASTVNKPAEFVVYTDKDAKDNHYIPSGWMGDTGDVKVNDDSRDNPHSGATCIQVSYSAKKNKGAGWIGVYWQNPANNWGNKKGGFDLTGMSKVTFWARGAKGGEVVKEFRVGNIKGTYSDTANAYVGPVELTNTWKEYSINLVGQDLSYVNGGFSFVMTADNNSDGAVIYLDDIKFSADPTLAAEGKKKQDMPFYIYADRTSQANHFSSSGYMGDHGDITMDGASKDDPYLGDSCIKVVYSAKKTLGAGWSGVMWQNPADNWGTTDAGFDLSKATKLTFWARGAKGGEFIEFKVGGIMGEFSDSDQASYDGPVILNKEWTQYTIDLKGKDMSYILGGFGWSANVDNNPEGATFYLDEIKFE